MSKYIIKNCPAYLNHGSACIDASSSKICCKERNDCLLKQLVEKMKEYPFNACSCGGDILEMLEIEEIE
jgi:hypothetical protein